MTTRPTAPTGPMRFALEGVGIFLRGPHAAEYAAALLTVLDPHASPAMREHAFVAVRELQRTLRRADPHHLGDDVQEMRAFDDCTEDAA